MREEDNLNHTPPIHWQWGDTPGSSFETKTQFYAHI